MNNLHKKHYYLIGIWFLVNLIQAFLTGLHSDESYYWMYSENLNWGYFDHPPMVALLIHLGHILFPGEIGVRLFFILFSTLSFAIILNELNEQKNLIFAAIFILSFPLLHTHISGFLAIPDNPLVFFTLLFLIIYKRFLQSPNIKNSIILSIICSLMIYSKYHAFLVIGLTVLSNLKLLRNKYFWLTALLSCIFLIPHIYWQIENGFPTLKYHFIDRAKPLRLKHITGNIINQLLVAGPFTFIIIFSKLREFKIKNYFDRALIFNIIGFYIVLFAMSFRNRIEAHWSAAMIPMLMFATYSLINNDKKAKHLFKKLAIPVIILIILFRGYMAIDMIPNIGKTKITFYNREELANEIKTIANGKKVAFFDNYAAISNYIFYTGDSAVLLSSPEYRFCQYDLWNEETYGEGDTLIAIQSHHLNPPHLKKMITGQLKGYIEIDDFQSLKGLNITPHKISTDKNYIFNITLKNNTHHPISLSHLSQPTICINQNKKNIVTVKLIDISASPIIKAGKTIDLKISVSKEKINSEDQITFYTKTKENFRGEMAVIDLT